MTRKFRDEAPHEGAPESRRRQKVLRTGLTYHKGGISYVTQKGQITITANLRQALGLKPGDQVMMTLLDDQTLKLERMKGLQEVFDSAPKVPPIGWKALEQEHAEEVAERIWRELHPENQS